MNDSRRARLPDTHTSGSFQVIALSQGEDNQNRDYKRRRPHKKTRTGCLACKQRRVKCDQAQPNCLRCRRNHRECVYTKADDARVETSPKVEEDESEQQPLTNIEPASSRYIDGTASSSREVARRSTPPDPRHLAAAGRRPPAAFRTARSTKDVLDGNADPYGYSYHNANSGHAQDAVLMSAAAAANTPNFRFFHSFPFPTPAREYGTPSLELLHHFETMTTKVFAIPHFTASLMPMAMQFAHLRGTILSLTAAHLCNRAPACKDYSLAEHYQQNLALSSYQEALATPLAVQGQVGVDALLMTAFLMNLIAFVLPAEETDDAVVRSDRTVPVADTLNRASSTPFNSDLDADTDPRRSWVFSPHPNRLGWLALQLGINPLIQATQPWHEKSFLRPLFANADDERRTLTGTWQSLHRVPQAWLDVFGFDRTSTPRPYPRESPSGPHTPDARNTLVVSRSVTPGSSGGHDTSAASTPSASSGSSNSSGGNNDTPTISEADRLYRSPLRVLAEIRVIPATARSIIAYFQFLGHIGNDFRHKLFIRDEKALWLFGMWMGLMCRHSDVWWVRRRARCDFRAIRLWLHLVGVASRPGNEGRLWCELLKDMDATCGYDFDADSAKA